MKVIITESQYEKVSGELDEELGVPEGILDVGEKVYDSTIKFLENFKGDIDDLEVGSLSLKGDFKVSDVLFDEIFVEFKIQEHVSISGVKVYGFFIKNRTAVTKALKIKSVDDPKKMYIGFNLLIEPGIDVQDICQDLKKERKEYIPHISHEIKHAFDSIKKKEENPIDIVKYRVTQDVKEYFGFVPEISKFLFFSYFIHSVENLVKPTELAASMRMNNVSKKEFLNFFLKSEIFKTLKDIQNFNYEEFKKKLATGDNIKFIKLVYNNSGKSYDGMSNEEIVDDFLKIFYSGFNIKRVQIMEQILTSSRLEELIGFEGEKHKFFQKYIQDVEKYGDDYNRFFRGEEKFFHQISTMMIKKLAKLYAMIKENPS